MTGTHPLVQAWCLRCGSWWDPDPLSLVDHEPRERNGLLCVHRCVELVSKAPSVFLLKQKKNQPCFKIGLYLSRQEDRILWPPCLLLCAATLLFGEIKWNRVTDIHRQWQVDGFIHTYIYIYICIYIYIYIKGKGKVIPLQARCGPEGG